MDFSTYYDSGVDASGYRKIHADLEYSQDTIWLEVTYERCGHW